MNEFEANFLPFLKILSLLAGYYPVNSPDIWLQAPQNKCQESKQLLFCCELLGTVTMPSCV